MQEKNGEHPKGDMGQILFLVIFVIVWALDSFFLKISLINMPYFSLPVRLVIAVVIFISSFLIMKA